MAQNVVSDVDGGTGAAGEKSEGSFTDLRGTCCGAGRGVAARSWSAGGYSALTNSVYFRRQNACAPVLATMGGGLAIHRFAVPFQLAPGSDDRGSVWARRRRDR